MMRIWRTSITLALAACGGGTATKPPPAWDRELPDARELGERRGLQPARGIVHLHSPFSHDACDGMPRATDGTPNEPCLQDLRAALCTTRIDFAALTDHDASMADEKFPTLFSMRSGDVPVMAGGDQVASRITCDNGHQVLVTIGGENDLMPIMLHHHVPGDAAARHDTYNGNDAAAVTAFREAGALAWVAHTESKPIELLRTLAPDGIEVYNLHANIDPEIREMYLGLDPSGAISAAVEFADTQPGHPEPDLTIVSFLSANQPAIDKWNALLGDGLHIPATAGSDAHQNAIPLTFADGERGDSYRRVLRWFSNIALVDDPHDPVKIEAALDAGRLFTAFEILGTPVGFDARVTTQSGGMYELGDTVPVADLATLQVDLPSVRALDPSLPAPVIRSRVWWINGTDVMLLAEDENTERTHVEVHLGAPGAYRVEISIVPHHLGPYFGDLGPDLAEAEYPWIYASPIYVQ